MIKQRIISSILLFAFAVLFAHTVVPHHHNEQAIATHESNHHDDDHEAGDDSFFGKAFSHFQHESNSGNIYQVASPTFQCSKLEIEKKVLHVSQFFFRQLFKPPLVHVAEHSFNYASLYYSSTPSLRGPPVPLA